jgi:integrase/recombinase XerD
MAMKLSTTLSHITTIPTSINSNVIAEFYHCMKSIGTSESYQNQNLKAIIVYAKFLGPDVTFYDIQKREQIIAFLDTKIKSNDIDPDKKWITTWNDYLWRIKYFLRCIFRSSE